MGLALLADTAYYYKIASQTTQAVMPNAIATATLSDMNMTRPSSAKLDVVLAKQVLFVLLQMLTSGRLDDMLV